MLVQRPSLLIHSVGAINVLIGLVFVAFGVYVLIAGADAMGAIFQLQTDAGNAAERVAGKHAEQAKEAAGMFAKGLSGFILAIAFVVAGCSIAQGLPNLFVGVGVLMRSNVARVFAIIFGILALLEGLLCLAAAGQSSRLLIAGLVLLFYAILTFVALLGRRASLEFSGRTGQESEPAQAEAHEAIATPATTGAPRRPMDIALLIYALVSTATAAVFATLYFTQSATTPANPHGNAQVKPGPEGKPVAKESPKLSEFHEAVQAGQIPRAAAMLKDIDIDEPDPQGRTALMKACAAGNVRTVLFLMALGAQVNQADKDGKTPMMHAVEGNHVSAIEALFQQENAPAQIAAFRTQYFDPTKRIGIDLKNLAGAKFAPDRPSLTARDKKDNTAMTIAIVKGHPDAAEKLLRPGQGGQPDSVVDVDGNTVLHLLAADGNVRILRHIKRIDFVNAAGQTLAPSIYAYFRTPESAGWRCCGLNPLNKAGREPWMVAAEKGHLDALKLLLPQPSLADLDRKDAAGKTALELAVANNRKEVVAHLTKLREDLTPKKKNGMD